MKTKYLTIRPTSHSRIMTGVVGLVWFTISAFGQETSSPESIISKKNSLSFSIMGATPLVGIVYSRIFSGRFSAEAGVGYISAGLGVNYYFIKLREGKIAMHAGAKASQLGTLGLTGYIPVGITYISKRFFFSLDAGPAYTTLVFDVDGAFVPWENLKMGFRF